MSIAALLVILACVCTAVSAFGRLPLWVAVAFLCIIEVFRVFGA